MAFKNIAKPIIDLAGAMYSKGVKGGWNKVAAILNDQGFRDNAGSELHGQGLCCQALADPQWAHLRKNKPFSTDKRLLIVNAILSAGYSQDDVNKIMPLVP